MKITAPPSSTPQEIEILLVGDKITTTITGTTAIVAAPVPTPVPTPTPILVGQNSVTDWLRVLGGRITETLYNGEKALKYNLTRTDPLVASGARAETWGLGGQTAPERWVKNRVAVDAGWVTEPNPLITVVVFQFHDDYDAGTEFHSPFDVVIVQNNWVANIRYGTASEKTSGTFILGPVTKGKFQDFVVHLKFTKNGAAGVQQVWLDGKLVLDQKLPMGYAHGNQPYYKQGIYAWAFNDETQKKYAIAPDYTVYFAQHIEAQQAARPAGF